MAVRAVGQPNIPALLVSLQPKLRGKVAKDGTALGAEARPGSSRALSVKKLLQRFDKFTVPLNV
ncbi:MAG: hypothetical protein JWQ87_2526 [Candidatus Sulfotelmatobacter sp.]|nr:hypothetical protein [Candidatus Sulfotelmatobacter sp.]